MQPYDEGGMEEKPMRVLTRFVAEFPEKACEATKDWLLGEKAVGLLSLICWISVG